MRPGFFNGIIMKYIFLTGCLLGLMACNPHRPHVEKWAETAASQWAVKLGNDHAIVACVSTQFALDNGDASAHCSVNMGDRIYPLSCWVDYDGDTPTLRTCVQDAR